MCTILCLSATHLSFLRPQTRHYSSTALQLLTQSARLFRQNLSHPITPRNCEALVGTAVLMQYLAWSNLDFLNQEEEPESTTSTITTTTTTPRGFNMSRDLLFLLSPGVRTLF